MDQLYQKCLGGNFKVEINSDVIGLGRNLEFLIKKKKSLLV